jgi:hypothetical protein
MIRVGFIHPIYLQNPLHGGFSVFQLFHEEIALLIGISLKNKQEAFLEYVRLRRTYSKNELP